jgi:predicted naringenin-chalcone synthase
MLLDISTASPPFRVDQARAAEELKKRMGGQGAVSRLIDMAARHSGIQTRHVVLPDAEDDNDNNFFTDQNGNHIIPDTRSRMDMIDRLITVSCTGFFAPGLDYHLINKFNLPKSIRRTHIGFMGCAAALVGVSSVWESLNLNSDSSSNTLLVVIEICSIHLQIEATRDNILANMIFADGAAAGLFANKKNDKVKKSLNIISSNSILFENSAKYMGWKIGNFGFEMTLSAELPKIILESATPSALNILKESGLDQNEIKFWALHPGGRAILDALQKGLSLSDEQLLPSRKVLNHYGNMSSVSILFVLKEILYDQHLVKDDLCCAIAFGPGLTMEVILFKAL